MLDPVTINKEPIDNPPADGTVPRGQIKSIDLWNEVADAEFVRATVIWHLQQIFRMSPVEPQYRFTSNRDKDSIHIHATFVHIKPHYPQLIVSAPSCTFERRGIGDHGWFDDGIGEDYVQNFTGRKHFGLEIIGFAMNRPALEKIMSYVMMAFAYRVYSLEFTRNTSLWVNPASPLSHTEAAAFPLSGEAQGNKVYTSRLPLVLINDGGVTFTQDIDEIEEIVVSIRSSEEDT